MQWTLPEQYRVERLLGKGGFAEVYLANDLRLRRQVALKIIALGENADETRKAMESEAQIIAQLTHPNIVTLYELLDIEGALVLAMEYVSGPTLQERGELSDEYGVLTLADILEVIVKLAGALTFAHRKNVVHLDVKPGNVIFTEDGEPKLVDFGLSRLADGLPSDAERIWGTPHFMAPEQIRNEKVSAAADQYALAVMLFLLATGKAPFDGATRMAVFQAHLEATLPDPRELNPQIRPELAKVMRKGLARDAANRYGSCLEFAEALQSVGATALSFNQPARKLAVTNLAPDESQLIDKTIAADILEPGLTLPREVQLEFALCGSICRESLLVAMNDYTKNRVRQSFAGRLVRGASGGVSGDSKDAEVRVGEGIRCRLGDDNQKRLGETDVKNECLVRKMGHTGIEAHLLKSGAALRVIQTDNEISVGSLFDEPPSGVHLAARQLLKGGTTQEHIDLKHEFQRASDHFTLREDAPPLRQAFGLRLLRMLEGIIATDLKLESMVVRLGAAELLLNSLADYLNTEEISDEEKRMEAAGKWLTEEAEARWERFASTAKAGASGGSSSRVAKIMAAVVTQARSHYDELLAKPVSEEAPKKAGGWKAKFGQITASNQLSLFPFQTLFKPAVLDEVRYPAGDGFPGAYAMMWLRHVLQRKDFLVHNVSWVEQFRRLVLCLQLQGLLARALTVHLKLRDMDRHHIIEATRLLEYFYTFNGAIHVLIERDPTCQNCWNELQPQRPIASALKGFLT